MRLIARDIERFVTKVTKGDLDECWLFSGKAENRSGHRFFWLDGKMRAAHRVAWEIINGAIPDGLCVCHRCDNPPCVNPEHLFLGTVADNNRDRDNKGRAGFPPRRYYGNGRSPAEHGTITRYVKHKCRCDPCRAANRAYRGRAA